MTQAEQNLVPTQKQSRSPAATVAETSRTTSLEDGVAIPEPFQRRLWIAAATLLGVCAMAIATWALPAICLGREALQGIARAFTSNPPWAFLGSLATAPSIVLTWYWRTVQKDYDVRQKQFEIERGRREERVSRFLGAAKMLSDDVSPIRIAGIHLLHSMAEESPPDRSRVVDLLCAFLRDKGQKLPKPTPAYTHQMAEVLCAVDVLLRIDAGPHRKNLRNANLAMTRPTGANYKDVTWTLANADLDGCDLSGCDLSGVNFSDAALYSTNLAGALLNGVSLSEKQIRDAKLSLEEVRQGRFGDVRLSGGSQ